MHDRFVASAIRGIEKNGRVVELVPVNDDSRWDVSTEGEPIRVKMLQVGFTKEEKDDSLIESSMIKFLAHSKVEPLVKDRLRDGGNTMEISLVRPLKPGATTILYRVFVNK